MNIKSIGSKIKGNPKMVEGTVSVSYTHLTLPTIGG